MNIKHLTAIYHANTAEHLMIALGVTLLVFLVLLAIRHFLPKQITRLVERTNIFGYTLVIDVISSTRLFSISVAALLIGAQGLELTKEMHAFLIHATIIILLYQTGIWVSRAIKSTLSHQKRIRFAQGSSHETTNLNIISFIARLILWIIILLLILDNLGVNITTLLASLGIGGIAVALAVQNILGDLFASLSIALDKPFVVGDFIVIDNLAGTVDRVGLKTTRIQSLSGEELIISNADLLKSRIQNYRKLQVRRIVFSFSMAFGTSSDKLRKAKEIVREVIEGIDNIRLDRVHLNNIGASSLNYEVVYFVDNPDFMVYQNAQEAINFGLIENFEAEGIEFALPTQTVFMHSQ